jgi:opacity protein-like surface antigen
MKKKSVIFIALLILSNFSFAQMSNMAIGLNGTLSIPIGDFNDVAKMGYGVSGSFFYNLSDYFQFTGTVGYLSWGGDKIEIGNTILEATEPATSIPILVGARYYLDDKELNPYISGELGLHVFTSAGTKSETGGVETDKVKGETNPYLGFGLGGGFVYELSNDIKVDGNLQYNIINAEEAIGHFALEIGFIVGI